MRKEYFLGISIVLSTFIACGYAYDVYRADKLLDLRQFEGSELVGDALNLRFLKSLKLGLSQGNIEEVNCALGNMIAQEQARIASEATKYDFDDYGSSVIDKALKDIELHCDEET